MHIKTLNKNSKHLKNILSNLDEYETITPEVVGGVRDTRWLKESLEKGCVYTFMQMENGDIIVNSGHKDVILKKKNKVEVVEKNKEVEKSQLIKTFLLEEYGVTVRFVEVAADKIRFGLHSLDMGLIRKMRFSGGVITTEKNGGCVIQVNAGNLKLS